ncbi:VanZ family protein [Streptomyces sp. NPDC059092]|uniref:VanZ family protein n=1 Tax=Streptomyces sp. NPDC059092 TaxID=3346725 RepID=UPI0036917DCE
MTGFVLLLMHLSLVGWVTLRPLDVIWVNAANLTPFAGLRADLALGPLEAARRIGEGLLLLAPVGVLLPLMGGRITVSCWASLTRTVTAGALLSLGIEMAQTSVPGRVVDVDSLLLNTVGVALAHLAVVPVCRARLRGKDRVRRSRTVRRGPASPRTTGSPRTAGSRFTAAGRKPAAGETTLRESALRKPATGERALWEETPQGVTPTISRVGVTP